jgi:hypothetical protein
MGTKTDLKSIRQSTSLKYWLVAVVLFFVGILLLLWSNDPDQWTKSGSLQVLIQQFGSFLIVSVALSVLWEAVGKRALLDEVLAKAQISKELHFAKILQVSSSFHQNIDWESLLSSVHKLDLLFAYARSWRNTHIEELRRLVSSESTRIRVVLPDIEDEPTIRELAKRFNYEPADVRKLVGEAITEFTSLKELATRSDKGASVEIWLLPQAPVFTYYRFDNKAVFALYSHRRERAPVPTFVIEEGGPLFEYFYQEYKKMVEGGQARHLD